MRPEMAVPSYTEYRGTREDSTRPGMAVPSYSEYRGTRKVSAEVGKRAASTRGSGAGVQLAASAAIGDRHDLRDRKPWRPERRPPAAPADELRTGDNCILSESCNCRSHRLQRDWRPPTDTQHLCCES